MGELPDYERKPIYFSNAVVSEPKLAGLARSVCARLSDMLLRCKSSSSVSVYMQQPSKQTFGLIIAYLIPGAVTLWGVSFLLKESRWLLSTGQQPTIGGFLYATLASIGLGITVSSVRWLLIDNLHAATGLQKPTWDFSLLTSNVDAYSLLVEFHYRYYQFYANMFIAVIFTYIAWRLTSGRMESQYLVEVTFVLLEAVYFASSRDALTKYYRRVTELLSDG